MDFDRSSVKRFQLPAAEQRARPRAPGGRRARGLQPYNWGVMTERDRERFDDFVRVMRMPMLRIAQNLCRNTGRDPEDLVHEALERALRQLERGASPDPLSLGFISTVMTNRHIDLGRRKRAEEQALVAGAPEPSEESRMPDPEQFEQWRGVSDERFLEAMAALRPRRVREAYELHAKGLRYKEISERLRMPEGTVGSDLSEARKQLRKLLAGEGVEGGGWKKGRTE